MSDCKTGAEHIKSLQDGRTVYLDGELLGDVTQHKAFRVARIVDEDTTGITIRGAKMLGTSSIMANEAFVAIIQPLSRNTPATTRKARVGRSSVMQDFAAAAH
jgi:aromatic ring hydroxylase